MQDMLDLFDRTASRRSAVNHQNVVGADLRFTSTQQLGSHMIARLEHRPDGRNLPQVHR